jgi:hypothetical protein
MVGKSGLYLAMYLLWPNICNYIQNILAEMKLVGHGTGLFTEGTGQVHMMIQLVLKKRQAVMVGSGSGVKPSPSNSPDIYLLS